MNGLASQSQLRASFLRWAMLTVPTVALLGFLAGQLGGGPETTWFQSLQKPELFPAPIWFPIVWGILYVMIGCAMALVCAAWGARGRTFAITMFIVQFAVNLTWHPVFFGAYQMTGGLIVIGILDVLVIITIIAFWRVRKLAALLMVPYLVWLLFASFLNYEFLQLNPDFDGAEPTKATQRFEI